VAPRETRQPWPLELADMLNGLAAWMDIEIASGQPPKWIAQVAAMQLRYTAAKVRVESSRR
jgi:hypothetical protein